MQAIALKGRGWRKQQEGFRTDARRQEREVNVGINAGALNLIKDAS